MPSEPFLGDPPAPRASAGDHKRIVIGSTASRRAWRRCREMMVSYRAFLAWVAIVQLTTVAHRLLCARDCEGGASAGISDGRLHVGI